MTSPRDEARERAIELLTATATFIRENDLQSYDVDYDGVTCDGECLADDCISAAEALLADQPLPIETGKGSDQPLPSVATSHPEQGSVKAAVWDRVSEEAYRYASHYPMHSDGRNTFIMFAEWADAQSSAMQTPDAAPGTPKNTPAKGGE